MLTPLSVKDAIWLDYAIAFKQKREHEAEYSKFKFQNEQFEILYGLLLDVKEIDKNTNSFVQIAALKGSKSKINPIKDEQLPSHILNEARKKNENKTSQDKENAPEKPKKYKTYADYIAAEESNNKAEQDRLYKNAKAFVSHVTKLEEKQGSFNGSRGIKELESEEERLKKIQEEKKKKQESNN